MDLSQSHIEPQFLIDIIIRDGKSERLEVYENEDVAEKCAQFCHLHGIGEKQRSYLTEMVRQRINNT